MGLQLKRLAPTTFSWQDQRSTGPPSGAHVLLGATGLLDSTSAALERVAASPGVAEAGAPVPSVFTAFEFEGKRYPPPRLRSAGRAGPRVEAALS